MLGCGRIGYWLWRGVILPLLAMLMAGFVPAAAVGAETVVRDLRVGDHGGKTRFVLELGDRVAFKAVALADPYRLVIDLPEIGWTLPARPLPTDVGLLAKLRYGQVRAGLSRLVLETKGPVRVEAAFMMEAQGGQPYRLVIDMVRSTREAVIAAAPASLEAAGDLPAARAPVAKAAAMTPPPKAVAATLPTVAPPASILQAATKSPQPPPPAVAVAPKPAAAVAPPRVASPPIPSPPVLASPVAAGSTSTAAPFALPPPKPGSAQRIRVIAIDAGHGGIDPGALGASGTYEKHITLAMARELAEALEKDNRYKAVLVRDRDVFVRLRERIAISRAAGADLFISLHADALDDSRVRGLSVYTLSEKASDREAELLAERENKADLIAGVDLSGETPEVTNILIDLARRETMNESARLAGRLVKNLPTDAKVLRNSHRFAGFAVLKAADVPSVLIELGFMSNIQDEAALKTKTYRTQMIRSIVQSIDEYFAGTEQARAR